MKFYWDSNNIKKDLKELKQRLKEETDPLKKEQLCKDIAYTSSIMHILVNEECGNLDSDGENYYQYLTENYYLYEIYYQIVKDFKKKCSLVEENIFLQQSFSLKKDEELELVNEFYKTIGSDYYRLFQNEFELRYKNLRFEDEELGGMFYIPGINHSYIRVVDSKNEVTPSNLTILIHEYAHAIAARMNPKRYVSNSVLLTEIETQFFELVSSDFLSRELNSKSFYNEELEMFNLYLCSANTIIKGKRLIEKYKNVPFLSTDEFNNFASKKDAPFEILSGEFNVEESYKYLISYLVAIELYMIYQKDKGKALEKLNKIITTDVNDSEYVQVMNEVTPNQNINLYKRKCLQKIRN